MKIASLFFSLICFAIPSLAQRVHYTVSFPNAVHHEARIHVNVYDVKTSTLTFRMSRSSPGRYATHEFGKNVYNVSTRDELTLKKIDADVYEVSNIKGSATLSYTLYGNYSDGTYAGISENSIHLNMPATFMWVEGLDKAPIEIYFNITGSPLTIATQLKPGDTSLTYTAPNFQYFMDSPVKIGNLHWREWKAGNQTIRLALEANASPASVDSLANMVEKITDQSAKVFGTYPAFDYGTYTFITSINPYVYGDGMEHRNSTIITSPAEFKLKSAPLSTFSHEFFHAWNVERIRPKTLEPFNFRKSNISNELWCAEGFTEYYGHLLLRRSELLTDTSFTSIAAGFINSKVNTPGGKYYTPIEASNYAVFTDAGISIDKTNFENVFTTYYYYGASVALALDLELRTKFNSSLDAFMQQMWKQHGAKEIPYTVADMEKALAVISNAAFAKKFFADHVYGNKAPDYQTLLAPAGMQLKLAAPGKAWMGNVKIDSTKDGLKIGANTTRNTPAYNAGLDVNDIILSVDGRVVKNKKELDSLISERKPGDKITVEYRHRGELKNASITLQENPALTVTTYEREGKAVTKEMLEFRRSWLGKK